MIIMKTDRLISIIMLLLEHKRISASKLAETFEVSTRTIYRDIEQINLAGIPVVSCPGVNGGVSIMDEYKVDKRLFSPSDVSKLLVGLSTLKTALPQNDVTSVLAKVKSIIPSKHVSDVELHANQITVDLSPWDNEYDDSNVVQDIKDSIENHKLIRFTYLDTYGNMSNRGVEPYRLVYKVRSWYLLGYCHLREDFRTFKISRISSLAITDNTFCPRECPPLEFDNIEWPELQFVTVKLRIDECIKAMIDLLYKNQAVFHCEQDDMYAFLPFFYTPFEYNILLSFGDKCECLEPEDIRTEIIRMIKNMSAIYEINNIEKRC